MALPALLQRLPHRRPETTTLLLDAARTAADVERAAARRAAHVVHRHRGRSVGGRRARSAVPGRVAPVGCARAVHQPRPAGADAHRQHQGRPDADADRAGEADPDHQGPVAADLGDARRQRVVEADQPAGAEPPVRDSTPTRTRAPPRCARSCACTRRRATPVRSARSTACARAAALVWCGGCRCPGPITFGRGVEVKVEIDDLSFEGASAFLLGCVLERFVARHVSINGFTQLRLHSTGRGDILNGRAAMRSAPDRVTVPASGRGASGQQRHRAAAGRRDARHGRSAASLRLLPCAAPIEALHPQHPRLGQARRPVDEPLRLGPVGRHVVRGVQHFACRPGRPQRQAAHGSAVLRPLRPQRPAAAAHDAYARERLMHHHDATLTRFADWFHHRLLLLFYRAWSQAQPAASLDRPAKTVMRATGRLAALGNGGKEWLRRDAAPRPRAAGFRRPADAPCAQCRRPWRICCRAFWQGGAGRAVSSGRWMPLPLRPNARASAAAASRATLSTSAARCQAPLLGRAVFDRQHHFRIHIGPLNLPAFESLLPVGSALPAVQALVRQYLGLEFNWIFNCTEAGAGARMPAGAGRAGWAGPPGWARRRAAVRGC